MGPRKSTTPKKLPMPEPLEEDKQPPAGESDEEYDGDESSEEEKEEELDFASALRMVQATKHKAWLESKSANKKKRKADPAAKASTTTKEVKKSKVKLYTVEELANEYYAYQEDDDVGPEKVTKAALTKRMNIEGDASNRVQAAEKHKFGVEEVEGKTKNPQIHVKYKGLRKELEERLQLLTKDDVATVIRNVANRGSSSRRQGKSKHLLEPLAMAKRSPTLFWNAVHHYGSAQDAVKEAVPS
ncbi:hypothetical protein KFL_003540100 [Klebsormidium nitens]|uniref:Uncharacterized protein n=1 Tax=Klebsormidium nitens TaxID=105231 RepID=A0A1Y1IFE8_KLENI|nr:hypothetical protein KFL_003540100 [Klebsormidium nitens]|eukprot:GAQ87457.1 hypothetical protein KFL_003540100 [Klebsormidium nitens]